jgi:UrcA family protein
MTLKNSLISDKQRVSFTSALLLGAMFAWPLALSAEQLMEEVHTHAERPSETIVGWSMTGQPLTKVKLQYHVRYDDLDLASDDGAKALRKRVTIASRQACIDLGMRYGMLGRDHSCSAAARRSAKVQVDNAIALARSDAARMSAKLKAGQAIAQTSSSE